MNISISLYIYIIYVYEHMLVDAIWWGKGDGSDELTRLLRQLLLLTSLEHGNILLPTFDDPTLKQRILTLSLRDLAISRRPRREHPEVFG